MATDRAQAALDLNAKLRLEAILRPKVRRAQDQTVKEMIRVLGDTGRLPDIAAIEQEAFEPILREHYNTTGGVFDHRTSNRLPSEFRTTNNEKAMIAAGLAAFFNERAPAQAERIGGVSEKNAKKSVVLANAESQEQFERDGTILSLAEEALIVGVLFSRSQRGRTTGIVMSETQAAAESAKLQENRVLVGDPTPITQESPRENPAEQAWFTQGDDIVRTSPGTGHRGADSQLVPIGAPFKVGGQLLLYPGDRSLGATSNNVMNCRCSAISDTSQVELIRRDPSEGAWFTEGFGDLEGDPITITTTRPSTGS